MAPQALTVLSISPSASQSSLRASADALRPSNLPNSFLGPKLSARPPNLIHSSSKPLPTVLLSLPTKNERASTDEVPKWSARAIKSFAMAHLQARKLKYLETGTESLLTGILIEGANVAATFLRANGITIVKVISETLNLLGKSDMMCFSPVCPPVTEQAQKALDWAVDEKIKSGKSGEVTAVYLLLGIWAQEDSAGHKILSTLGFNDKKAKELAESIDQDNVYNTSKLLT